MPWKECNHMDERLRFVARLLDGEKMAPLCREFGISRKTGYKLYNRYKDEGLSGLEDKSRSPYRHPNKIPFQVEREVLRLKKNYTDWGAPKIRDKLVKLFPSIKPPAVSTIHSMYVGLFTVDDHLTLRQATLLLWVLTLLMGLYSLTLAIFRGALLCSRMQFGSCLESLSWGMHLVASMG